MKLLTKKEIKKSFKKNKRKQEIAVILENFQYARNVAGVFRTIDAAGISKLYLTGITTTPPFGKELQNASRKKERHVNWEHSESTEKIIIKLKKQGFKIIAVDLTDNAIEINKLNKEFVNQNKVCFVFGNEVHGIKKDTLSICDLSVYIPMYGMGASLNVATTVGIVLYSI